MSDPSGARAPAPPHSPNQAGPPQQHSFPPGVLHQMPVVGHSPHYPGPHLMHAGAGQDFSPPGMPYSVAGLPQPQQVPSLPGAYPSTLGPSPPQLAASPVGRGSGQGRGPIPPVGSDQLVPSGFPSHATAPGQLGHGSPGSFPPSLSQSGPPHSGLQQKVLTQPHCSTGGVTASLGGLLQPVQSPHTTSLAQQPSFVSSAPSHPPQLAPGSAPSLATPGGLTQTISGVAHPFSPAVAQHEHALHSVPHSFSPPSAPPLASQTAPSAGLLPPEQLNPLPVSAPASAPALMGPNISGSVSPAARSQLSVASEARSSAGGTVPFSGTALSGSVNPPSLEATAAASASPAAAGSSFFPLSSCSSVPLSSTTLFSPSSFTSASTVRMLVDFLRRVPSFSSDSSSGSPGNTVDQASSSDPCSCSRCPRLSSGSTNSTSAAQQTSARVTAVRRCVSVLAELRGSEASSAALSLVPAVLLLLDRTPPSMVEGEVHTFRQVLLTLLRLVAIGVASTPLSQLTVAAEVSKPEVSPQQEDSSIRKEGEQQMG
ncbi:non-specific serine threonine protein kinase, partial [Cystoisospora suis]